VIPVRDVIPTRTAPVVVLSLVVLQVAGMGLLLVTAEPNTALIIYAALTVVYLWLFGENVEDRTGHWRFLTLYAACGLAAGVAQALLAPGVDARIAAAGGATAGIMGAYVVLFPQSRVVTLVPLLTTVQVVEVPAVSLVGVWLMVQWPAGTLGAHLAALATGMCGVLVARWRERLRVEWWDLTC
jgi:membrane associated rhomboid family serine protease